MMRPGPTMAGEIIQQASEQPESLHLHFSESHPSGSSDAQQVSEDVRCRNYDTVSLCWIIYGS